MDALCRKTTLYAIVTTVILILLLGFAFPQNAHASIKTGSCGETATYSFDTDTGQLTISGTGAIENYSDDDYCM